MEVPGSITGPCFPTDRRHYGADKRYTGLDGDGNLAERYHSRNVTWRHGEKKHDVKRFAGGEQNIYAAYWLSIGDRICRSG